MLPILVAALLLWWGAVSGSSARPPSAGPAPPGPGRAISYLAFAAPTIDGWRFDFAKINTRRRIVILLFDPTGKGVTSAARAAERLYQERHEHNLEVIGVMIHPVYWSAPPRGAGQIGFSNLAAIADIHMKKLGATFPCVVDPNATVTKRYLKAAKLTNRQWLTSIFVFPKSARGAQGRVLLTYEGRQSAEPVGYMYRAVLFQFGIEPPATIEPLGGHYPKAPDIVLVDTKGKTHRLSSYRGKVVVVVFLMLTCPKCKIQLPFLDRMRQKYGQSARPGKVSLEVLGVCTDASGEKLKKFLAERGYTFPVAGDTDWKIRGAFRFRGGVPDTFVIAPDGTVRYRHRNHLGDLSSVLFMEISTLLGLDTKPMLPATGYAGGRACRVCHAGQHTDWTLTRHACAWETLVRIGKENDPKCVRCHVVGFGEGGFVSGLKTPYLSDVQCESCHGRSGCSAFTGRPAPPVAAAVCKTCHDAEHSPRFEFATARPRVLHNRAEALKKLPRAEREKAIKKLCSGADRQLFNPDTPYIGSAACGKCHPTSYKALAGGRHTVAINLLKTAAPNHWRVPAHKQGVVGLSKAQCLRCHVTGFGQRAGFPAAVPDDPAAHPMASVGCEACHGPGKAHADDPKKPRAIAKLGGTCNECNILPICRLCHDDKNSPRFDYSAALTRARHKHGKAVKP